MDIDKDGKWDYQFWYKDGEVERVEEIIKDNWGWEGEEKADGFITPDDGSKDCFVHHNALQGEGFKSLSEGQEVEFEIEKVPKGPQATNVARI